MDTCLVKKETPFSALLLSSLENNVLMVLPACFHTYGFSRISHNSKLAHKGIIKNDNRQNMDKDRRDLQAERQEGKNRLASLKMPQPIDPLNLNLHRYRFNSI